MTANKPGLDDLRIDRSDLPEHRPWRRAVFFVVVVVVLGALAGWYFTRPAVAEVRTAPVREISVGGNTRTVLNASGYVTARRKATVSSKVTGKVVEVLIEEGMRVDEGQVLARLDTTNIDTNLRLAEAHFRAAGSALEETRVLRAEADREVRRRERLVRAEIASDADLERAEADADSLAARLARQERDVDVAKSEIAVWEQQREDLIIRAPFDGVVVSKDAQPGEMISPVSGGGGFTRTGIGTVVDMTSLEIEVDVNESYINRVAADQQVQATLDAYPDWRIPCHVIAIVPTADRQKATVRVRIGFEQLDPRILPDMGVKVAFRETEIDETPRAGLLIPIQGVRRDNGRDVVLVVREGRVERRAVTLGGTADEGVLVTAGLASGEHVVIQGPEALADGDRVKVVQ